MVFKRHALFKNAYLWHFVEWRISARGERGRHRHRKIMRQKHALISMRQSSCAPVAEWKIMQFTFMASNNKSLFTPLFSLKSTANISQLSRPKTKQKFFSRFSSLPLLCCARKPKEIHTENEINFAFHGACAYNLHKIKWVLFLRFQFKLHRR